MDKTGRVPYLENTHWLPLALKAFLPPGFLALICIFIGRYAGFLAFHTLAELLTVFISLIAMTVAVTSQQFTKNHFVVVISLTAGWCSTLDIAHILVYKGMSILPFTGGNESTQLWISARFIQAMSFVIATYFFRHVLRVWILHFILFVVISTIFIAVFSGYFPQTFIDNYGLTPFKTYSEWVIIVILFLALVLLWQNRHFLTNTSLFYLSISILTMILTETLLSFYTSLFGIENEIAHVLRIFSYWFIYIALVIQTLTNPFSMLARAANTYDHIPDPTLIVQMNSYISQANHAAGSMAKTPPENLVGLSSHTLFHNRSTDRSHCPVCAHLPEATQPFEAEVEIEDGSWMECILSPIHSDFFPNAWVQVIRNITPRKRLELERNKLMHTLGERIKELKCLYHISEYSGRKNINIEELFAETARRLPQAFQYPELMVAKIESIWGKFSSNPDVHPLSPPLIKTFCIDTTSQVCIEVGYHHLPTGKSPLFLSEEVALLDSVATILASTIERIISNQQIAMSRESGNIFKPSLKKQELVSMCEIKKSFFMSIQGFAK